MAWLFLEWHVPWNVWNITQVRKEQTIEFRTEVQNGWRNWWEAIRNWKTCYVDCKLQVDTWHSHIVSPKQKPLPYLQSSTVQTYRKGHRFFVEWNHGNAQNSFQKFLVLHTLPKNSPSTVSISPRFTKNFYRPKKTHRLDAFCMLFSCQASLKSKNFRGVRSMGNMLQV